MDGFMIDSYDILDMLDWNNRGDVQQKGITLAQEIKDVKAFL